MKNLHWKTLAIGVLLTTLGLGSGAKLTEQGVDSFPTEHLAFRTKSNDEFSDKQFAKGINELGNSGWELYDIESM